jgi:hypothetical protein
LHVIPHVPAAQVAVPFVPLHVVEQDPQRNGLVLRLVSHPLVTSLSQFPNPALHTMPHTPPVHDGVPPAELHTFPQTPQLL